MSDDSPGFFRNLTGLANAWVSDKRRSLQAEDPTTNVDEYGRSGGKGSYQFGGQDISHSKLRDIKQMRESGGTVSQLMHYKALLHFGEGVEISVGDNEETEQPVEGYPEPLTLKEWLQDNFDSLDQLLLELGEDALWYPYAVGEIRQDRTGGFADFLPAQPWTLVPETDAQGEIIAWHEETRRGSTTQTRTLAPDEIEHLLIHKNSARDTTGISEVLRNEDEIMAYKENEQAIQNAIELHGFPQRHVKVGREDGAPVRDQELRRIRTLFDPSTTDANTAYFTGQDVDVEALEAEQFDYSSIHEMSMRQLTTALGLPLEVGNVGSDGLGSGKPAELRMALLKLTITANQRMFCRQFVDSVMRPVIERYSPFDSEARIELGLGDPLEDIGDMADVITQIGDHLTNDEIREKLDMAPHEDEEIGESYRTPAEVEQPEDEGGPLDGGGGGLFSSPRSLAVPDSAVSIDDRSEAPEGAQIVTGDRGGLYYIPQGTDSDGGSDTSVDSPSEIQSTISNINAEDGKEGLENHVAEKTGIDDVRLPLMDEGEGLERLASSLVMAGELDLTRGVESIELGSTGDEFGSYRYNDSTLNMNFNLTEEQLGQLEGEQTVGNDVEWFIIHELAHSEHGQEVGIMDEQETFFEQGMSVSRDGDWVGRSRVDLIEDEVSEYATTNPGEFVAEVYAGLAMGEEYSDDVLDVYEEFGGPSTYEKWRAQQ